MNFSPGESDMLAAQSGTSLVTASRTSAAAVFQREWGVYRKIVDHNYLFHREAYRHLRRILVEDALPPFRILDLACGDASATAGALKGLEVASYCGVDLSAVALDLARAALADLGWPVSLREGDFVDALADWCEPVDVIWVGLSLHHLRAPAKLEAMRAARRALGRRGMLLAYENTSPDDANRAGWLERWDLQEHEWSGLAPKEWRRIRAHVRTHDYPETVSRWRQLGREAGFGMVQQHFVAPSKLFCLFSFRP
jgi:SAM-dependent methyltransferase